MRKQTRCVSLCGCAVNHCLLMAGVIGAGVGAISPTAALHTITTPTETLLLLIKDISDHITDSPHLK